MPRARKRAPRPEPPPIGAVVRIKANPVHPKLAGYTATVVKHTEGVHVDASHLMVAKAKYLLGGNPIVEIRGRRFLFRTEHLEVIQ